MPANTSPIFTLTPRTEWGTVTTANTAKDGTGTVVTVFTAQTNGSFVEKLVARAAGTNTASVLRIFINNGSTNATATNNTLYKEQSLPATTLSEVAAIADVEVPLRLALPNGYKINITIGTTVATSWAVTGVGGDY